MPADREIVLTYGSHRALVSTYGASLRRYSVLGPGGHPQDVLWGYSGTENKQGGQGDVLIPFPGRVDHGRYTFEGRTYQMPQNDKETPNAIHGFLRSVLWEGETEGDAAARFHTRIGRAEYAEKGYPFDLSVSVTYRLDDDGLTCEFAIKNTGEEDAPVGVGFHPYFTVGTDSVNEVEACIPANLYQEFNDIWIPTGNLLSVQDTPLDFRQYHLVGDTRINNCFTDLIRDNAGRVNASIRNPQTGRSVTVWLDEAFRYIVAYTGDAIPEPYTRRALAIEPQTCSTDAFNHPEWGLKVLSPGEEFRGAYGVKADGII